MQKLYGSLPNANVFKALIAAEYVGEKIESVPVQLGTENKKPDFLKLNPAGKVMALLIKSLTSKECFQLNVYVSLSDSLVLKNLSGQKDWLPYRPLSINSITNIASSG